MGQEPIKTIRFNEEKRQYDCHIYPLESDVSGDYIELKDFYQLWNDLRGNNKLPNVKDVTFETLIGWH